MMIKIMLILILECVAKIISENGICTSAYKGCCQGTFWNEALQKCIDCYPGYFKANCSTKCPYPYYGRLCDFMCDCTENECDFATGCLNRNESTTSLWTSLFYTMTTFSYSRIIDDSVTRSTNKISSEKPRQPFIVSSALLKVLIKSFGSITLFLAASYVVVALYGRHRQSTDNLDQRRASSTINIQDENSRHKISTVRSHYENVPELILDARTQSANYHRS